MTISSTQSKIIYAGNGSTAAFAVPFMFLRDDDVEVVLSTEDNETVQALTSDYSLTGAGDQMGGVCTMNTPPLVGQALVIRRDPTLVQEVDYVENDAFPAETHEAALDKLTMICQALSERLDRTITFRVSSAVSGVELPEPEPGKLLAWNENGNNLANKAGASMEMVSLPLAIAQGGTGGTEEDEALENLGGGNVGRAVFRAESPGEALASMDAEPADTAILKADMADLLQAVFGDEAQDYTGTDLSGLDITRNHIAWNLTADSQFSDVALPYDGTYIFHVYPAGKTLLLAGSYASDGSLDTPDPLAGEIRLVVEQFNGRKTIVSLQNIEV